MSPTILADQFINHLIAIGALPPSDKYTKVVIDAECNELVKIYTRQVGDQRLLQVDLPAGLVVNAGPAKQDWRIGLAVKPKHRWHELYYEAPGKVIGVDNSDLAMGGEKLRIEIGGKTIRVPADEWTTC